METSFAAIRLLIAFKPSKKKRIGQKKSCQVEEMERKSLTTEEDVKEK